MRLVARLALAVPFGLIVAVAIDVGRVGGWTDWLARHSLAPPYDSRGAQVDIGGRSMYLDCRGAGSPTIVLEAGMGGGAAGWGLVLPALGGRSRTCAYDRAGLGRSEPRGRHSAADVAADLRALLAAAGEQPPFLVVAHSLGGVYARVFADAHRDEVAGIVLVDSFNPDLFRRIVAVLPADKAPAWRDFLEPTFDLVERTEDLDWDLSAAELANASVAGIPLEVVVVRQTFDGIPDLDGPTVDAMYRAWRSGLESLSDDVRITVLTDSGHLVQLDRPSAIVDATERLLDRGRERG
jgi:pimeloyl-ACP methyl ester carboxylesterase